MLATICLLAFLLGAAAHLRAGAAAAPWMKPTLTFTAMIVAIGGLLITDGAVRRASGGLRMPVLAVGGGFAMLWAYELNVQLIGALRSEEHTSELQSLMRISYAVFCLKKKKQKKHINCNNETHTHL